MGVRGGTASFLRCMYGCSMDTRWCHGGTGDPVRMPARLAAAIAELSSGDTACRPQEGVNEEYGDFWRSHGIVRRTPIECQVAGL